MRVLVLNPPMPDKYYISRDLMGGMGQKSDFARDFKSKLLSLFKSNFIRIPVMQLVYITTILNKNHDVKVVDAANEDLDVNETINRIEKFKPDFVFMMVSASAILFERDVIARKIKEILPDCKIITIGETITYLPELLKQPFDIAIQSESEKIIEKICNNEQLDKIDGIIYRKNGKLKFNKPVEKLEKEELDKLPFPKWELFPYKKYRYYPLLFKKPVATLLSSRGCPYGCHYCSYSQNMGGKWRGRSSENVVSEIENDVKYGFKGIFIRDPLFTVDKKRTEEICRLLIEKNIKINFVFETRPELLDRDLLDKLYKAGCKAINLGIESPDKEVLERVGRKIIEKEKLKEIVEYAEKIGIRTTCFFILGLPGSTKETIKRTIELSFELNPSHADYKVATPFPGTKLYDDAKSNNWIISENYNDLGGYSSSMQINEELTPEYLENVCSNAFKDFYLRKEYVFREIKRGDIIPKVWMLLNTTWKMAR